MDWFLRDLHLCKTHNHDSSCFGVEVSLAWPLPNPCLHMCSHTPVVRPAQPRLGGREGETFSIWTYKTSNVPYYITIGQTTTIAVQFIMCWVEGGLVQTVKPLYVPEISPSSARDEAGGSPSPCLPQTLQKEGNLLPVCI